MSHIVHCSRACEAFDNRVRDKQWKEEHPGYIGFCMKYNKLVQDPLCGCETKPDGSVTLWNFSTFEEYKEKCAKENEQAEKIREQIMAIKDTGLTNMFDARTVQRLADERGYHELVCFIEERKADYTNFILYGKVEVLE